MAPLLGWLLATPAVAATARAHALPAAAATRGSACSSAAAAASPFLSAQSSGVLPNCSREEGRGAGRRAIEPPHQVPHPILRQRVHPRGRKEEGDNGNMTIDYSQMQRGVASLQGPGRRRAGGLGGGSVDERKCQEPAKEPPARNPLDTSLSFPHPFCSSQICACRQERAEGVEMTVAGGTVGSSATVLQQRTPAKWLRGQCSEDCDPHLVRLLRRPASIQGSLQRRHVASLGS